MTRDLDATPVLLRRAVAALAASLVLSTGAVAAESRTPIRLAAGVTEPAAGPAPLLPGGGSLVIPRDGTPFSAEPPEPDFIEDDPDGVRAPATADHSSGPVPEVRYGVDALPPPVRATREAVIAAARTGDPEQLRALIERATPPTRVSSLDGGDPVEVLRAESGDEEGREVLAILLDVLDAGWVRVDAGTADERYVWPYFARYPLEALTPPQMVELFRILTAGDFEGMRAAGAYGFFRVEIAADGRWAAFLAGE